MNFYDFIIKFAVVLATLGLVIFFHELGHFLAAKSMKVRVEIFSLGFGPEWFGFTKGSTRYRVCLFPVGGYLKMAGDEAGEGVKGAPDEYLSQKWWKKMIIVFSGPFMNFVLAWLIFFSVMSFIGIDIPSKEAVIGSVLKESPAEKAGLLAGDRILSINGGAIAGWEELTENIHSKPEQALELELSRNGQKIIKQVTSKYDEKNKIGLIGVTPHFNKEKYNILRSSWESLRVVLIYTYKILESIVMMIAGRMKPELAGPIGIVSIIGDATGMGLTAVLNLIAMISISLGLINLILPVPIVDGGVLLLLLIEGIRRKALSDKSIGILQRIGLMMIILLAVFATYQDILRIFINKR
jgi:regulator of sigma E protease